MSTNPLMSTSLLNNESENQIKPVLTQTIAVLQSDSIVVLPIFLRNLSAAIAKYSSVQIIENENYQIIKGITLLVCDPTLTKWTMTCLAKADKILIVANAQSSMTSITESKTWEQYPAFQKAKCKELVILHETDAQPQNTARLLDHYQPTHHYHVCNSKPKDIGRVARFLTNNAIGLVLSGGGARGFAHIGVFEALRTLGVEIDAIGGTSIGSIMAAAIASGMEGDVLRENVFNAFVKDKPLNDYTIPLVSFAKGDKLERVIKKYFGTIDLEDLWLPFFCVSADITLQEERIHHRGKLWSALRASVSLPGVLPPVVSNNSLLVDGGVMNNLPIDVMQDSRIKNIIAVDLNDTKQYELNYDKVPTWKTILLNIFKSKRNKYRVPKLLTVMSTATVVGSNYHAKKKRQLADVCFLPPVGRFSFLNFNNFDDLVRVGYEHVLTQIKQVNFCLN